MHARQRVQIIRLRVRTVPNRERRSDERPDQAVFALTQQEKAVQPQAFPPCFRLGPGIRLPSMARRFAAGRFFSL